MDDDHPLQRPRKGGKAPQQKKSPTTVAHSDDGANSTPPGTPGGKHVGRTSMTSRVSGFSAACQPRLNEDPATNPQTAPTTASGRRINSINECLSTSPWWRWTMDPSSDPRERPVPRRQQLPPGSRPQDATDPSPTAPRLTKNKPLQCCLATQALRNQRLYSPRSRQHPHVPGVSGFNAAWMPGGRIH